MSARSKAKNIVTHTRNRANALPGVLFAALLIPLAAGMWFVVRHATAPPSEKADAAIKPSPQVTRRMARPPVANEAGCALLQRKPIQWGSVAHALRMMASTGKSNPEATPLDKCLAAWPDRDLISAFHEIGRSGLSDEDRNFLEWRLASLLIARNPAQGFPIFMAKDRTGQRWELARAYQKWMEQDAGAAIDWLREHTADGGWMDAGLIEATFYPMLATNPERSERILSSLPAEMRLGMLSSLHVDDLELAARDEWVRIVRSLLPDEDRRTAISWQVMNISDGDGKPPTLDEAATFLDHIQADAGEIEACLMQLAEQPASWMAEGVDGIGRLRQWAAERAPDLLDKATLRALEMTGPTPEIVDLALALHMQTGDDAYLKTFLQFDDNRIDPQRMQEMIGRLHDANERNFYQQRLRHRPRP